MAAVLTGAVARVVAKNAISALPSSLDLRRKLIKVLNIFSFPGVKVGTWQPWNGTIAWNVKLQFAVLWQVALYTRSAISNCLCFPVLISLPEAKPFSTVDN